MKKNTSYVRPALPSLKGSERKVLTLACVFFSLSTTWLVVMVGVHSWWSWLVVMVGVHGWWS